jgi:hypothetical protein
MPRPYLRYRIVDPCLDTSQTTKAVPQITASAIVSHIKLILMIGPNGVGE